MQHSDGHGSTGGNSSNWEHTTQQHWGSRLLLGSGTLAQGGNSAVLTLTRVALSLHWVRSARGPVISSMRVITLRTLRRPLPRIRPGKGGNRTQLTGLHHWNTQQPQVEAIITSNVARTFYSKWKMLQGLSTSGKCLARHVVYHC